nr:MAG TPA: hypothetical protein [Bacteriophage sp.]
MHSYLFLEITVTKMWLFFYMAQRSALTNAKVREDYNREM